MQGIRRRVVYLMLYEGIAVVVTSLGLATVFGVHMTEAGLLSVVASTVAILWNLVYNMGFEAIEARFGIRGRGLVTRIAHAVGFEGGLVLMLVPTIALMLGITLIEAFLLNLGLIVFFLFYTFFFNLAFDRLFGLPASARAVPAE